MQDEDLASKLSRNKGFTSLRPFFDETNTDKILDWGAAKKERIEKQRRRILSASGRVALPTLPCDMARLSNALDDIDSEDELIKDPSFAALLNDKREISVAGKAYKYTYEGTYITDKGNLEAVYNYIENTGESDVYFIVGNLIESNNNANKAVYRFDWATGQIGFTLGFKADPGRTGGYNGDPSVGLKKAEKSFSAMKMVGFGYGLRNGQYRGDKVVFVKE